MNMVRLRLNFPRPHNSAPALLFALLALSACGGSGSANSPPNATTSDDEGLLRSIVSNEEFVSQFRAAYIRPASSNKQQNSTMQPVAAEAGGATDSGGSYSTTYTLESDVDEFDVLKYDGDHLYIAPTLQARCCFIAQSATTAEASSFAPPSPDQSGGIRILSTKPDTASAVAVATIPLQEDEYVQGLYISGPQLISIGSTQYYGPYGRQWLGIASWLQQNLSIKIYDTTTITAPELKWDIGIEGGLVDSRRIGDTLYIISRHSPQFENIYYYPSNQNEADANAQKLAAIQPQDLIPVLTVNGESRPLFTPQNCLLSRDDQDQTYAYPVYTSVTAIPLTSPGAAESVCFNEESSGIYVSQEALYLSQYRYSDKGESTRIHKFKLTLGRPEYRGSADIAGQLWGPGQSDFRMSERNGLLRIVTTVFTHDNEDLRDHQLSILGEASQSKTLELVASLPNTRRPQEIGKANEALYGVRFIDERAYFVTFEQIDPLYAIDLSNPADPYIAGELEIPGVSDFLHPVSKDLLLGLGRGGPQQQSIKLSLFNIADITQPQELNSVLLGVDGGWNYSEAQYNRHAFTYLPSNTGPDRLAVPVQSNYQKPDNSYSSENRLYLLEINAKSMPSAASVDLVGSIIASPAPNAAWYGGQNRSVLDGNAVYFLSGDAIWSGIWGDPTIQSGPY
tara:strand:- start:55602 stop:57641 length:2040 start_codon:yes stop_codon:yes gene_type:complete